MLLVGVAIKRTMFINNCFIILFEITQLVYSHTAYLGVLGKYWFF